MRRSFCIFVLLTLQIPNILAQQGGEHIYDFLNLCSSARVAALGGEQIALNDIDASMVFHNPSALTSQMDEVVTFNYVGYMAGVNYGYTSYVKDFKEWGTWSAGVHYVNYGKFIEANSFGQVTGTFRASEYAFLISGSNKFRENFRGAASFKSIYSVLERYNSFGLAVDLGLSYESADSLFVASFVARNLGFQVKPYYNLNRENLPFQLLVGVSQKLAHAPFRLVFTYRHLQKFDNSSNLSGSEDSDDEIFDKALKHFVLGTEFLPGKNLILRIGYNFQRREELKLEERSSTVGFSWGFGVKVSRFSINYASARYHLAGTSNHFSISTRLSDFNFR